MSQENLEAALKQLPQIGRLIDDDPHRQVWRFELDGKPLGIHFYPRSKSPLRFFRGNPALRELRQFQSLQKAGVPSPRALSALVGFRLSDQIGDALLIEAIEPRRCIELALDDPYEHFRIRNQILEIGQKLARNGLGHDNLTVRSFALSHDELLLTDASGVAKGGLKLSHLQRLAHSASRFATRSDYIHAWDALGPTRPIPAKNPLRHREWRRFTRSIFRDGGHFGRLAIGDWSGVFTRVPPQRERWSTASAVIFNRDDWAKAWPALLERIRRDQLTIIKRDAGGDVLAGDLDVGGKSFPIIVKNPRRKYWWRHLTGFFFRSRAQRTWIKTWKMLIRDVPCEWPMLLMERRVLGRAVESILLFERVPGDTLAKVDLKSLDTPSREQLFHQTGAILRKIEDLGFTHTDAKSTNWIVYRDPRDGIRPILIDVDGVRHYRWSLMGIDRLLRAMKQHPQYTPADSLALCQGFAPKARFVQEELPA